MSNNLDLYFITSSEFNAYQMEVKLVYFYSEKNIVFFSLVTDTISVFTVAKPGFLGNFGTGFFIKRFDLTQSQFACDAYAKAHSIDFLLMLISYVSFVTTCF